MHYEPELKMLQNTLEKCRINTTIVDFSQPVDTLINIRLHPYLRRRLPPHYSLSRLLPPMNSRTIYRIHDPFLCRYLYMALPDTSRDDVLLVGPYLSAMPSRQQILERAEENGLTPHQIQTLEKYYTGIPVIPETSPLFVVIEVFAEKLWGADNYTLEDIQSESLTAKPTLTSVSADNDRTDLLWQMQEMEQRYQYENQIMDAVSRGQLHKVDLLFTNFTSVSFEQRLSDPVRNLKNYCIIMNTLLRKAAEQGGVHPMYLDNTSSAFAGQIEQLPSTEAVLSKMREMFRSYCRLVQTHSVKDYSPTVKKVITLIDMDLAGDLNLRSLSATLNISGSYLSTLFKKETGMTLTEFINHRRITYAAHLLDSTQLQIQTVAQHCGIIDIHYFSKVFKRVMGMTPREYRLNGKKYT